jgi:crotonobetaine/carnitine-CoA ligase
MDGTGTMGSVAATSTTFRRPDTDPTRPAGVQYTSGTTSRPKAVVHSLLSTLWACGTVVLTPKFSASRFWDVAARERCTWTAVVSFCVRAFVEQPAAWRHDFRGWGHSWCIPSGKGPGGVGTLGWFGMTETVSHPVAFVVGAPEVVGSGENGLVAAVEERCSAELADVQRPREVHVVADLPRSSLEKGARGVLRARLTGDAR